jgi:D-sedoheptulose 7-phosphate isomerase
VLRAAKAARQKGIGVLSFTARDGGLLKSLSDHTVIVPTDRTDRAQEIQLCMEHAICEAIEQSL